LYNIFFPSPMHFIISPYLLLTICFGHIRPSSGVYYFAKIAALYGMSKFSYRVNTITLN
jgi:hypothetical protein